MFEALFRLTPMIVGAILFIWAFITILRTDGLLKYKHEEKTYEELNKD